MIQRTRERERDRERAREREGDRARGGGVVKKVIQTEAKMDIAVDIELGIEI